MTSLEDQLAEVFSRGLDDDPELRASFEEALSSSADSGEKYTKAEANYRKADDAQECGICEHFRDPGRCSLVSGSINPSDVCDYFKELDDPSRTGDDEVDA